jgi:hypothetical protein
VGAIGALVVVTAMSTGGVAAAAGGRVGPDQIFVGLVNGTSVGAVVKVVCPGPSNVMGRALPGQTLAVSRAAAVAATAGDTGANGRRIVATVEPAIGTAGAVVFGRYDVTKPFPTTVPVPCGGAGIVRFTPAPGGPGARPATVTVEYVNLAATSLTADVTPVPPRIVAHPNSVMVDGTTTLVGSNFPPHANLRIVECSARTWIVPQNPCDTANAITVHTNSLGHFKSPFKVLTCPAPTTPGFAEICYVGNPRPLGIDEVQLVGAAKITVTGP